MKAFAVGCAAVLSLLAARPLPAADGAAVAAAVRPFVDQAVVAGAVTLVGAREGVLDCRAVGSADLESKAPMRTNAVFWIASMTKPMTAAAVLMLCDEGKLRIDDPVEKHVPEFRGLEVREKPEDGAARLVPPATPVTLKHLLTHTSGLETVPPARPDATLAELTAACAAKPLKFQPGSKWEYCNAGINALGRVIEVASGKPYAEFMRERLIEPLGMADTTFWPHGDIKARVATSYIPAEGGGLAPTGISFLPGELDDRTRTALPAGGLFSTASDYSRFLRMLMQGGTWNGRRLLSAEAVREMTRTQTGDLKTGFTDGMSFGLGCGVLREPQGVTAALSPGSFGHGGAYGTQGWADPVRDRIYILMIQRAKLQNADGSDIRRAFQDAAAAAW